MTIEGGVVFKEAQLHKHISILVRTGLVLPLELPLSPLPPEYTK